VKTLTIRLDDELHRQFKILSVNLGKDMQAILIEHIQKLLDESHRAEK